MFSFDDILLWMFKNIYFAASKAEMMNFEKSVL